MIDALHPATTRQINEDRVRGLLVPHKQHWCSTRMCALPTTQMTVPLLTPVKLLKFADDTMASFRVAMNLHSEEMSSWLSGAVTTTWSGTSGNGSRLEEEHPSSPPTHHHEQHCGRREVQVPG